MIKFAIITVTFNAEKYIQDFLDSLNSQNNKNFKVFFVDNNSVDNTKDIIIKNSNFEYELISNDENFGVAKGNNIGIKNAQSENIDWILLANNDTFFSSDTLLRLSESIKSNTDYKAFVTKIYDNSRPPKVWYSGGNFSLFKGNTGYQENLFSVDNEVFNKNKEIKYSPTCFMLINSSVFNEIGLMDEKFFVYYDDTDFCWRLKKANISILYLGKIFVFHKIGSSTGGVDSDFTIRYSSRNRVYFLRKSMGIMPLFIFFPIFLIYYTYRYLIKFRNLNKFMISIKGLIRGLTL